MKIKMLVFLIVLGALSSCATTVPGQPEPEGVFRPVNLGPCKKTGEKQ